MKHLSTLCLLFALFFVAACSKDDESPTYKKADFIGKWKQTSAFEADPDCSNEERYLEFQESVLVESTVCSGSSSDFEVEYTYDNKSTVSYTLLGIEVKYVITELSSTTLKVDLYVSGVKDESTTYTKVI